MATVIVGIEAAGTAILSLDRWTGSSSSYNTVVSYTCPTGKTAILTSLELACSNYLVGVFRVTIAGVVKFADKYLTTHFNPLLSGVRLKTGQTILVEAHSDGAISIDVDAAIEGREIS